MKFFEKQWQEYIKCPKCQGVDFTDIDRRTETTTYHVWCLKKDCKTDILVPTKLVLRGLIEIQ